ncbi:hypothetical protein [Nonomuraea sp. NPDC001831]|uniref:hypothetical protein n=1 Tax=Nonomuraea sp. NPDC001831 TaxID=3364340 RepID=UPI0036CF8EB7
MHRRILLIVAVLLGGAALYLAPASAHAESGSATNGSGAPTAIVADSTQIQDQWRTYAHYIAKKPCQVQGRFLMRMQLAKAYTCTKVKKGWFKVWRLRILSVV